MTKHEKKMVPKHVSDIDRIRDLEVGFQNNLYSP